MNRNDGFTTVELMIVVGIVSVMAGIASLSYLSMRPALRLNGATRQVLGDLMAARMKAVDQNRKVKVFFPSGTNSYKRCDDQNGDGTVADGEGEVVLKNIQDNYPGITLSYSNANGPVFSPRGTAANLGTVTLLNSSGKSKTITVVITGRIKIN